MRRNAVKQMVWAGTVALMLVLGLAGSAYTQTTVPPTTDDGKLRIIVFGAHPDDCEIKAGGTAALWAAQGHHVKLVSVTNGDIGHWEMSGGALAIRRTGEVEKAAELLGIDETEVLDNHDGELLPTLENRKTIVRLIREWKADLVMTHRSNDYHPDHRYTGILLQDAAFMVTVPYFCPDIPHLKKNPVFMFFSDRFQKPNPSDPDIVVSIDSVLERKLDALVGMESQFVEYGVSGSEKRMYKNPQEKAARQKDVRNGFIGRFESTANRFRETLITLYGERGRNVRCAEAFELCEYGRQPSADDLKALFPFLGK